VKWRLTACSEEQPQQQTGNLSGQTSTAAPSPGFYEMADTSRPEVVVYDHISHNCESASGDRNPRPNGTSNIDYENTDAIAPVYSN